MVPRLDTETLPHPPALQAPPVCAFEDPETDESGLPYFSYASPEDGRMKRMLIRAVERATGQPRLKRMYLQNRDDPREDESFWDAAIRYLALDVRYCDEALEAAPKDGPLVVVANHPFGVLDGIVLSWLISKVRPDFKILTNSVLYRAPELRPYLLPIDFAETREATRTNLKSRADARALLKNGGVVVIFPGGTVSTAKSPFGRAEDPEWKPFTSRLIQEAEADVLPVFFAGQNSRLFQIASRLSYTLRISLLFKEVHDRIGTDIDVRIGAPLPFADLQHMSDRAELAAFLRAHTYALGR